jgi:hypothetical protein
VSFATDLLIDGVLRVLALEASTTDFASLTYALATKAGVLDGTNQFDARIVRVGNVRRGFGQNRVAAGGTCDVVLDNTDGGLDFFVTRTNLDSLAQLRFRLKLYLVDPSSAATAKAAGTLPTFTSKMLGEYVLTAWPEFNGSELTLQLGDDILGPLSQTIPLPTLADWAAVGTTATNPLKSGFGRPDVLDQEGSVPVQLAFGEDWVTAMPHLIPIGTVDAAYQDKVIIPVCCTTDSGAGSAGDITSLRILFHGIQDATPGNATRLVDVPRTQTIDGTTFDVWTVERSPTISKFGIDFKVIYLVVRADLGVVNLLNNWITGQSLLSNGSGYPFAYGEGSLANEWLGGYPSSAIYKMRGYASDNPRAPQYAMFGAGVLAWYAKGVPLSARTQQTSEVQHSVDVVTDLATYYVQRPLTVDATTSARVKAALPSASCAGVVQPWTARANGPSPSLRQVLSSNAQSADFDIFMDWDGDLSFAATIRDYTTATAFASLPSFTIEHADGRSVWMPAEGERHSVFNRIYLNGGKADPAEEKTIPFQGPFDVGIGTGDSGIEMDSRVIEVVLEQGWRPWRQQSENPLYWRTGLDTAGRQMVRFSTEIRALQLDLGDLFRFTWRRGTGSALFDDEVFQVENIVYAGQGDEVEITAVWQDDITTDNGYLLDDEDMTLRSKGALSGQAQCDGTEVVEFGGTINLGTMAVDAGDILVLRDSTQADDVFTRNASFRIATVLGAIQVSVIDDTGAPATIPTGNVANADWSIVRGATTYHTAITDPTNYPDGGEMYGKMTDTSGQYSNAAFGLRLLGG